MRRAAIMAGLALALAGCGGDGDAGDAGAGQDGAAADGAPGDGAAADAGDVCGNGVCAAGEDWYLCNADCPGACDGCLFAADYDTPDPCSQWSACQRQAAGRITGVTEPVRAGSHAGRFEVQPGDFVNSGARAEVVLCLEGSGCVGEAEGSERWYGWSSYWPTAFASQPTWQLFTQWHHVGNSGSPPIEFYVNGDTLYLRTTDNAGTDHTVHWTAPLVYDRWRNFIFGVRFANDGSGWVELWLDGEQVLARTATRTMIDEGNILKQGLYRNAAIDFPQVLLHDHMRIGATRDQVD